MENKFGFRAGSFPKNETTNPNQKYEHARKFGFREKKYESNYRIPKKYVKKTPYDILELSRNANENDIKKSFHRLAKKWHPDKNPNGNDVEFTKKFQEISEAYELLSKKL